MAIGREVEKLAHHDVEVQTRSTLGLRPRHHPAEVAPTAPSCRRRGRSSHHTTSSPSTQPHRQQQHHHEHPTPNSTPPGHHHLRNQSSRAWQSRAGARGAQRRGPVRQGEIAGGAGTRAPCRRPSRSKLGLATGLCMSAGRRRGGSF
jgi:hypothetical protein